MDLTKVQLSEKMRKHASKGNGLHDLMEIMIESMIVAERGEFLAEIRGTQGIMKYPPKTPTRTDALELSKNPFMPTFLKK